MREAITVLEQITEMLYEEDPQHLAGHGCPRDEYKHEAEMIQARYQDTGRIEDIAAMVSQVFYEMFSATGDTKLPVDDGDVRIAKRLRAIFALDSGTFS